MTASTPAGARSLADQVVCVTGAGRGLGRAIAEAFAAEGARLVLGARTASEIEELAASMDQAIALQTDVRSPAEIQSLIDAAVGEFGRLDVMVNNAGVAIYGPLLDVTERDFDAMVDTNLKGTFFGCQAALKVMKDQRAGLIINISSITGRMHLVNESAYASTKWAVNGLSGVLRLEAQKFGVRVTCVCPGGIDTPFWKTMDYYPFPTDRIDPERDFMSPEEVALTIVQVARTSDRYVVPEVVMVPLLSQL